MKLYAKYLICFLLGILMAFGANLFITRNRSKPLYIEKREPGYKFISPLLEIDIASEMISNKELLPFKDAISRQINISLEQHKASRVSLYFRELNDGVWFAIGNTDQFIAASLKKLPLMIALLKMSEINGEGFLQKKIKNDLTNDHNEQQNFKPALTLVKGESYTVLELIKRMIMYSENNAFMLLTKIVDQNLLAYVYTMLQMPDLEAGKEDKYQSVQTFASFLRVLYNSSYLSKKNSELALSILADSDFKEGLVAGVPPVIPVAHKFGETTLVENNQTVFQLHDCGIVYYPNNPYIICIMSQGSDFQSLDDIIKEVSASVFNEIDRQHKQ